MPERLAPSFVHALASGDATALCSLLTDDAALLLYTSSSIEAHRPRDRVIERLLDERARWLPDSVDLLDDAVVASHGRAALQLRTAELADDRRLERSCACFLQTRGDAIARVELHISGAVPSARRTGWIAPAELGDDALDALLVANAHAGDVRHALPPVFDYEATPELTRKGSGGAHPSLNRVYGARFADADADARIAAVVDHHRARGAGFVWHTGPHDEPRDLAARLERAGFALAGYQTVMARRGLDPFDIPTAADVRVVALDWDDPTATATALDVIAEAFAWTPAQRGPLGAYFAQRAESPVFRAQSLEYLAFLGDTAVGWAGTRLRAGVAQLEGAATRPACQGRGVYRTLLHRRLADAAARGYHIASITALPMSRRVVERYGFRERYREAWYVWMPVPDPDVVAALIPDS